MKFNTSQSRIKTTTINEQEKLSNNPNTYGGNGSGWNSLGNMFLSTAQQEQQRQQRVKDLEQEIRYKIAEIDYQRSAERERLAEEQRIAAQSKPQVEDDIDEVIANGGELSLYRYLKNRKVKDLSNYKMTLGGKVVYRPNKKQVSTGQEQLDAAIVQVGNLENISQKDVGLNSDVGKFNESVRFKDDLGIGDNETGMSARSGSYLGFDKGMDDVNVAQVSSVADKELDQKIPESSESQRTAADKVIKDNAQFILNAAQEFGVNPGILAAAIYAEHGLNVDWKDHLTDVPGGYWGVNTSIGIAQVQVQTAKQMEDLGYMPKIIEESDVWVHPETGYIYTPGTMARVNKLRDPATNIRYAAAYLRYWQDRWKEQYPVIDGDTGVLTTLYNQGDLGKSPHPTPRPNPFGRFARENYYHVRALLGL